MASKVYKYIIKLNDITIKTISEGKLMTYESDTCHRLGLLDPYGSEGYQIEVSATNPVLGRKAVIGSLKGMGFKIPFK